MLLSHFEPHLEWFKRRKAWVYFTRRSLLRINKPLQSVQLVAIMQLWSHLSLSAGEEAPVSVLHRCQRKRMGDGISNSLH